LRVPVIETSAAVPEMFRNVFLSEESGSLHVSTEARVFSLHFDRGMIRGADARGEGVADIPDGLAGVARIIEMAFASVATEVSFTPAPPDPDDSHADIVKTVDVFLCGIRAIAGFDEILEALVGLEPSLTLKANSAVPIDRLKLEPLHGFVLSRLTQGFRFADIASAVGPDQEREAAHFVYALLLLGAIGLEPPLNEGLIRTEQVLADRKRDLAREEAETAFIQDLYAAVKGQNPYQVLGIPETSTPEMISRAYEERQRALAPERFLTRVRDKMRAELAIIESRVAEVYLVLTSARATQEPAAEELDIDQLSLRRELTKTDLAATLDEQEKMAESYYEKAKKYFSQRDYFNCIQFCQQAIRQNDQTPRYFFLLAEAQVLNPDRRWQKMAEQSYLSAVRLDPWNADYLVTLGDFYKKHGFASRARRQYQRAVEIQPGHARARDELAKMG
jgi:tetratricopeptide (TPR) repeat protein